jgi:hypothetical protein
VCEGGQTNKQTCGEEDAVSIIPKARAFLGNWIGPCRSFGEIRRHDDVAFEEGSNR